MKRQLALTLLVFLVACGPTKPNEGTVQTAIADTQAAQPTHTPAPTAAPTKLPIPESFKIQIMSFIEEGTKLDTMTGQGVNYNNFKIQFANTESAYKMSLSFWPDNLPNTSLEYFDKALNGWIFTNEMWGTKIEAPNVPEFYNESFTVYKQITEYLGDDAITMTVPDDNFMEEWRNLKYLPIDDNISLLMGKASTAFNQGKDMILKQLVD